MPMTQEQTLLLDAAVAIERALYRLDGRSKEARELRRVLSAMYTQQSWLPDAVRQKLIDEAGR